MPEYSIEMLWECSTCHTPRLRGLSKHCTHCGKPKTDEDREYFPDSISIDAALRGDKLRHAKAGPDWACRYCQTLQSRLNAFCAECGAILTPAGIGRSYRSLASDEPEPAPWAEFALDEDSRRRLLSKAASTPLYFPPSVILPHAEPQPDPFAAEKGPEPLFKDGPTNYREPAPREDLHTQPPAPPVSSDPLDWENKRLLGLLRPQLPTWAYYAGPICVALALILWLVFRVEEVDASVSALSWNHRVLIDRYQIWRREGWSPDFSSFDVQNEGQRIHHYDHVRVGSHRESYQEEYACGTVPGRCRTTPVRCTSNRNGTANCSGGDTVCDPSTTKYCTRTAYRSVDDYEDQPRYQSWYSWKVWDWGYNRTVQHAGSTDAPTWPSDKELTVPLAPGEKERNHREATYKVTFTAGSHDYSITPGTEEEFRAYRMGDKHRLRVGVAHGVEVLSETRP